MASLRKPPTGGCQKKVLSFDKRGERSFCRHGVEIKADNAGKEDLSDALGRRE